MPRKSSYHIGFSDAERARLEATARKYTSPYRDVSRVKIVLYAAQGLENDEIAARLDTPRQIVSKWRKRFFRERLQGLEERSRIGRPALFPPSVAVAVKALACQLPYDSDVPLSRWSVPEIRREVIERGVEASIGESTLWRWFTEDAIRPWAHHTWIFPRDPAFERKAGRVLDPYQGEWEGRAVSDADCVVSTDEKTSIQARRRIHFTLPPAAARAMRVEHEYERRSAWAYLAAWDVRGAKVFGRCEAKTRIRPFGRLVGQVMRQEPYRSALRVFWIMDNGSSHRGQGCIKRLRRRWPTIIPVHTPVHASWLNHVEVYFSIIQRKVLTPSNFHSRAEREDCLLRFQDHYCAAARPFQWKFTRTDLKTMLSKIQAHEKNLPQGSLKYVTELRGPSTKVLSVRKFFVISAGLDLNDECGKVAAVGLVAVDRGLAVANGVVHPMAHAQESHIESAMDSGNDNNASQVSDNTTLRRQQKITQARILRSVATVEQSNEQHNNLDMSI